MALNDWTGDAKQAIQANPDYFVWWYTVKSVGLAVAIATVTYYLGKERGRSEYGTFKGIL